MQTWRSYPGQLQLTDGCILMTFCFLFGDTLADMLRAAVSAAAS